MSGGLLTEPHSLELEGGWSLELLSAREALETRREAEELAAKGDWEQGICANACLLAHALRKNGEPCFKDGGAVLESLTARQIGELARRWDQFDRTVNPSVLDGEERVEQIKKAWSTRLMSVFNGVCSARSALCPQRREPEQ